MFNFKFITALKTLLLLAILWILITFWHFICRKLFWKLYLVATIKFLPAKLTISNNCSSVTLNMSLRFELSVMHDTMCWVYFQLMCLQYNLLHIANCCDNIHTVICEWQNHYPLPIYRNKILRKPSRYCIHIDVY